MACSAGAHEQFPFFSRLPAGHARPGRPTWAGVSRRFTNVPRARRLASPPSERLAAGRKPYGPGPDLHVCAKCSVGEEVLGHVVGRGADPYTLVNRCATSFWTDSPRAKSGGVNDRPHRMQLRCLGAT